MFVVPSSTTKHRQPLNIDIGSISLQCSSKLAKTKFFLSIAMTIANIEYSATRPNLEHVAFSKNRNKMGWKRKHW